MNTNTKFTKERNTLLFLFKIFIEGTKSENDSINENDVLLLLESKYGFNLHYENSEKHSLIFNFLKDSVIPHKINVFLAGIELVRNLIGFDNAAIGIFIENLIYHDLSKFSEFEAFGYAQWFSGSGKKDKALFDAAWHNHKMNNKHHPEYWFDVEKDGSTTVLEMPFVYVLEMVADWVGAGMSYGNAIDTWLPDNLPKFVFHENTCKDLQYILKKCLSIETAINGNKMTVI